MKEYIVIYERGAKNWGAYSPDVPGCIATGKTRALVKRRFKEALKFHIDGLLAAGLPIPESASEAGKISIAV